MVSPNCNSAKETQLLRQEHYLIWLWQIVDSGPCTRASGLVHLLCDLEDCGVLNVLFDAPMGIQSGSYCSTNMSEELHCFETSSISSVPAIIQFITCWNTRYWSQLLSLCGQNMSCNTVFVDGLCILSM